MVPTETTTTVDVLVIGAGPAGVMCANGLARYGVSVRVIDQNASALESGQADGIQPRTIEVLQSYGLADRLLSEGNHLYMAAFYNAGPDGIIQRVHKRPTIGVAGRYPHKVTLHQGRIESLFLDSMRTCGVEVARATIPTSLEIDQDPFMLGSRGSHPVTVGLRNLATKTEETVKAKYVVACDGAHSWTRKALGIPMEGEQLEFVWGVVDTVPQTDFPDIRVQCAIHGAHGSVMLVPRENDSVRFYVQLARGAAIGADGRADKGRVSVKGLLEAARNAMTGYNLSWPNEIEWWTVYTVGQRVAASYQQSNRVFIAGDACHTHSPMAGQGMNASMNDTHNLSWKLAHVLKGWARPSLLTTYEFERRKYAQDLIEFDRQYSTLYSGKLLVDNGGKMDRQVHMELIKTFGKFAGFTSGIHIQYAPSPLTLLPPACAPAAARALVIGQRMPSQLVVRLLDGRPFELQDLLPADGRWKLVLFPGNTCAEYDSDLDDEGRVGRRQAGQALHEALAGVARGRGESVEALFSFVQISAASGGCTLEDAMEPPLAGVCAKQHFIDQREINGRRGGEAYESYGVLEPAVVVVRPDGYVGTIAPLLDPEASHVKRYFSGII
ncbi:hypothetical protein FIBSPDRAFT_933091 [Athelia psychrophila]|uniref:FAD binding domain-containing protein n=1 Tax=Athelia psychrophila TaxID=1759441 RepID=A0A166HN46_9AGAM|nr:hypothetical protein FIBSPDRAFT_933091 [Fibularhizoctonia sp. CBS 109695]